MTPRPPKALAYMGSYGQWTHWWWTLTNLTRGRGCLHGACHRWEGVKIQVQQTGLLRERPGGLKLGSRGKGGKQLVTGGEHLTQVHTAGAHTHKHTCTSHTKQCHPCQTP